MSDYKGSTADYPTADKTGGGGRRFAIIMLFLLIGLAVLYAVVTSNSPGVEGIDTTPPAPTAVAGVSVNVQQDGPAVSVNVEQAAPPAPPPPVQDNTAALMAADHARDARAVADRALEQTNALHGRVDLLHGRVQVLEAIEIPDLSPTLIHFERQTESVQQQLSYITSGLIVTLLAMALLAIGLLWLVSRPTYPPHGLTIAENQPHLLHGDSTVLHGDSTVLDIGSGEPLVISENKPVIPKKSTELRDWERAYIQTNYNRLKTYTAVSNHIWGYHGKKTLQCIKDVVG